MSEKLYLHCNQPVLDDTPNSYDTHTSQHNTIDHNTSKFQIKCSCILCRKEITIQNISSHYKAHHTASVPKSHCAHCATPIYNNNKFCSKSCAASYNNLRRTPRTAESKAKTSKTMKGRVCGDHAKNPELHPTWCGVHFHPCSHCGKIISIPRRKTCSIQCRDAIRSKNGTLKRRIAYNGFIFQSTWEVKIAEFLDQNKVLWQQPKKRIQWFDTTQNKTRTYLPDFYLPSSDWYLDVKNPFKQSQDFDKLQQLKSVMKLFIGDISEIKQFVTRKEGINPPIS